jgi:hypothetical protein
MQYARNKFFNATQVHSAIACTSAQFSKYAARDNFASYTFAVRKPYKFKFKQHTLVTLQSISVEYAANYATLQVTLVFNSAQKQLYLQDVLCYDNIMQQYAPLFNVNSNILLAHVCKLLNISKAVHVYAQTASYNSVTLELTL